jgi:hypothetical protein
MKNFKQKNYKTITVHSFWRHKSSKSHILSNLGKSSYGWLPFFGYITKLQPQKNIDLHVFKYIGMIYIVNPSANRTLTIELDCKKIILSLKLISNDKNN